MMVLEQFWGWFKNRSADTQKDPKVGKNRTTLHERLSQIIKTAIKIQITKSWKDVNRYTEFYMETAAHYGQPFII